VEGVCLSPRARQILTRSSHQPQGGPPTQGLRSHHQPPNRLGTVAHQLKPKRHPSAEIRHPPSRRRTGGSPPQRQCRGHGLHQWQLPLSRPTIHRTVYHPARLEATLGHVIIDGVLTRTIPLHLTRPNAPAFLDLSRSGTSGLPGQSASCPAAVAPKSSANASESDSATPARSSP